MVSGRLNFKLTRYVYVPGRVGAPYHGEMRIQITVLDMLCQEINDIDSREACSTFNAGALVDVHLSLLAVQVHM